MTESTEAEAPRAVIVYSGTDGTMLPPTVNPHPSAYLETDRVVEVDGWAAEHLCTARPDEFEQLGATAGAEALAAQVARDEKVVEVESTDPDDLKGEALHLALVEANLGTAGTADEKRARLAEHRAELEAAQNVEPSPAAEDDSTEENAR